MNAYLLYPDRDLDPDRTPRVGEDALVADLGLDAIFDAMAGGDPFVREVARTVVLSSLTDPATIRHRQRVLADCLRRPEALRELSELVSSTIEGARRRRFGLYRGASPTTICAASVQTLEFLLDGLVRLRRLAEREAPFVGSPGLTRLYAMLRSELDDRYVATVADHLSYLRFRHGVPIRAALGPGNVPTGFTLLRGPSRGSRARLPIRRRSAGFDVDPRDEAGLRTLADIRGLALNEAANALAGSVDHIDAFLVALRAELAFYVGCVNLHERLRAKGEPVCIPTPLPHRAPALRARGLYDVALALHTDRPLVGNDLDVGDRRLVVITGANRGGKSTLLRAVGTAQLLMQCGMFVGAERFEADVRDGIFTHFEREEDPDMESGKLDEELRRMSAIVDAIRPTSLLLCNESFSSTNEREGSEIAAQVVGALVDAGVKVIFVTHLFELADRLYREEGEGAVFLRAERLPDGTRTFRILPGAPEPTSHGRDLLDRILGTPSGRRLDAARGAEDRAPAPEADRRAWTPRAPEERSYTRGRAMGPARNRSPS